MQNNAMNETRQELAAILDEVGAQNVWRPVLLDDGNGMPQGVGDDCDGLPVYLPGVSFAGKTVVDLGCNFGHHTQYAARAGAKLTVGVDLDPRVARGATLFARLAGVGNIRFEARDVCNADVPQTYDMAMMIDTIGKGMVRSGLAPQMLRALAAHAQSEILVSVTPWYPVATHLEGDFDALYRVYPADCITDKAFLMEKYVLGWFGGDWEAEVVHRAGDWERAKNLWHLVRR